MRYADFNPFVNETIQCSTAVMENPNSAGRDPKGAYRGDRSDVRSDVKPGENKMAHAAATAAITVPMSRREAAIADIQKLLLALNYKLPKFGVDGIRGIETSTAIRQFQRDHNLKVDGDPGPETVAKMNQLIAKDKISLVPSTAADVKPRPANKKTAAVSGDAIEAFLFFIGKGWTSAQAAGLVGNLQAESGASLQINAVGDGGQAYGIAQWHPPRQADFKRTMNKPIQSSTFEEQLEFVHWELNHTESKAGRMLRTAKTAEAAAAIVDQYYERSSGAHRDRRIQYANAVLANQQRTV